MDKHGTRWQIHGRQSDYEILAALTAYWEADGDPISDDYTPEQISAEDLFQRWVVKLSQTPGGLVRIFWFVSARGEGLFEVMPFQYNFPDGPGENFLNFYRWPVDPETGTQLNWLTLPVEDKRWNRHRADKGGFIQEATDWKPSILQPYVALESLVKSRGE